MHPSPMLPPTSHATVKSLERAPTLALQIDKRNISGGAERVIGTVSSLLKLSFIDDLLKEVEPNTSASSLAMLPPASLVETARAKSSSRGAVQHFPPKKTPPCFFLMAMYRILIYKRIGGIESS